MHTKQSWNMFGVDVGNGGKSAAVAEGPWSLAQPRFQGLSHSQPNRFRRSSRATVASAAISIPAWVADGGEGLASVTATCEASPPAYSLDVVECDTP
jgi:hypothetical protein